MRSLNDKADNLSKIVHYDDLEIVPEIFQLLDSRWGPILSIVSPLVTTLKFQDSFLGSGIQVHLSWTHFFQTWQGENCWVVPSVVLLSNVLKFMSHSRAQGTLVLPYWPFGPSKFGIFGSL